MKKIIILCLIVLTLVSLTNAQTDRDKMVFSGFNRVGVGVSDIDDDVKALGLNSTKIENDVSSALKDAGFIIDANAPQSIYVSVRTIKNPDNTIGFALILYLDQAVILQRNSNSRFSGTTWDISGVYTTDTTNLVSDVSEQVLSLVDQFLVKYRKANQTAQTTVAPQPTDDNVGFTASKIAPSLPPQLVIYNKTRIKIYLTVNGRQYVALPKSTKTIVTTAGNVSYQARGAGYDAFAPRKLFLKQGEAYSLSYSFDK
jgi:hypothetical protein